MEIKSYSFRYSSNKSIRYALSVFSKFFKAFSFVILTTIISILNGTSKYMNAKLWLLYFVIAIVFCLLLALICSDNYKTVNLNNTDLEIVTASFFKKKSKIKINYADIERICNDNYNLKQYKKKREKTFLAGDYHNCVKLVLVGGKEFYFAVKEQESFIEEVHKRMEMNNQSDNQP